MVIKLIFDSVAISRVHVNQTLGIACLEGHWLPRPETPHRGGVSSGL